MPVSIFPRTTVRLTSAGPAVPRSLDGAEEAAEAMTTIGLSLPISGCEAPAAVLILMAP